MVPNNMENHIKDKLEKRTLTPSSEAWNKLSEQLDVQEEKQHARTFWWLGIAASIIGVVFIVSEFTKEEIQVESAPRIVVTPTENQENNTSTGVLEIENIEKADQVTRVSKPSSIKKMEASKVVAESQKQDLDFSVGTHEIVETKNTNPTKIPAPAKKPLTFEEQKIQDVVAKVQNMKNENQAITDADIEALLIEAQKDIKRNRLYNETTNVVDANALLQDVEAELDQSFRSKVFEALKSSYNSVKTAVAQRNE
jgi:hypothetical protein